MGVVEAVLALIGLVALVAAIVRWYERRVAEPVEVDLAAPYREGLHAAARLQGVAQELEQQIYVEALRHAEGDPGGR
ncbi:MAG: hypothetical protein ABSF69_29300 [Polyangiaceae bacterium]|jgi:hypothetical protein